MALFFIGVFVPPDVDVGSYVRATTASELATPHTALDVDAARHIAIAHFGRSEISIDHLAATLAERHERNPLYAIVGAIDGRRRWLERASIAGETATVDISNGQWALTLIQAISTTAPDTALHITLARSTQEPNYANPVTSPRPIALHPHR